METETRDSPSFYDTIRCKSQRGVVHIFHKAIECVIFRRIEQFRGRAIPRKVSIGLAKKPKLYVTLPILANK